MRQVKLTILLLLILAVIALVVFVIINYVKPKTAGIFIETNPESTVYLNGEYVGRTPFKSTNNPKELIVKLVPDSFGVPLAPYETKLTLVTGVETVLRREFAPTSEESNGEIVSFEKIGKQETSLAIVTTPDSTQINVDGTVMGYAPFKTSDVLPGEHTVIIRADGYQDHSLKIRTYMGYKLTAIVTLAKGQTQGVADEIIAAPVTPPPSNKPAEVVVEILSTPTGYLRVRKEASAVSEEIGRVIPGKQYLFLAEDVSKGWYQIDFDEGVKGWISSQYAKKIEDNKTTPTQAQKAGTSLTPTQ